ncbi:uncharacterized protein CCOS01_07429 [Colletotrichum costaricense]|uniref:Uncharacterized protein n=1 Tax=Colletotrichum costaricense TaxID=1209916 RepID=A0AAI9YWU4_9PEZI|nr:uncharacterized protein CCOS01_07429 [Colletotrichum costaricense]KAK1527167.1 hypothetical protein CCOS01_07429 [Colletotrichum costaricense]
MSDSESDDFSDVGTVIDFGLGAVSEAQCQFRFNSDGIYTPRETAVLVRCSLADIIHGQASLDDATPCVLVVFDFQLDRIKATRRIRQAIISLTLPEGIRVRKGGLSPKGRVSFHPQAMTLSRSNESSLSAGLCYGASIECGVKRSETVSLDTTEYATVNGWTTRQPKGRVNDQRPHNCVKWALMENPALPKHGVPPHFRAAVLLERCNGNTMDRPFVLEMEIKSSVDLKTSIENLTEMFGKVPRGCLRVDPFKQSTENLRKYDSKQLADVVGDLWGLSSGALETESFSRDFVR